MQASLLGVGEIELAHGARDADVGEAALFLEAVGVVERALVREQAIFETREEHQRELESLGGVQRHHLHAILPSLGLAFAGLEHGMGEERVERRHRLFAFVGGGYETARRRDQFEQVLGARLATVRLVFAVVLKQTARREHLVDDLVQRQCRRGGGETVDHLHETLQRGTRTTTEAAVPEADQRRRPERAARFACAHPQGVDRLGAQAARGQVDHALEGGVVVAVRHQAQVSEGVLDLGALKESQAAVDLVRYARGDERFFEGA